MRYIVLNYLPLSLSLSYCQDCQTNPEECVKVSCNITNLGLTTVDIMITGFLDERFYYVRCLS